jgi:hypothetical protein
LPRDCLLLGALRLLLLPGPLRKLSLLRLRSLLDPLLLWLLLLRLLSPLLQLLLSRFLGALRLRLLLSRLLGPLLRLLSGWYVPLLAFVLISACLRLLRLFLKALLLCGRRRCLLLPVLMLFRLALSFVLLVALRKRRDHRPEQQKEGSHISSSNDLHSILLS